MTDLSAASSDFRAGFWAGASAVFGLAIAYARHPDNAEDHDVLEEGIAAAMAALRVMHPQLDAALREREHGGH